MNFEKVCKICAVCVMKYIEGRHGKDDNTLKV